MKGARISDSASKCLKFLKESSALEQFSSFRSHFTTQKNSKDSGESSQLSSTHELRQYIDYKFQVLTEFLILREKNINDKLDTILDYVKLNCNKKQ